MQTDVNWEVRPVPDEAVALQEAIGGHPLVAKILALRGLVSAEDARAFLDPALYVPAPPEDLPDLAVAVDQLQDAVALHKAILIWGDFDVDGQTATALLLEALRRLDAEVICYIPDRLQESHGIRPESLARRLDEHQPDLLLTCDTGISAHKAVEYANERGVTVLITDHHALPEDGLPAAAACVNPRRLPPDHPLSTLPGVGVAYKLIEALYNRLGCTDALASLLDLVALGIVADVASQVHDTRYLLQMGLERLRNTERLGLRVLAEVAGINLPAITTEGIGFQIAPRLNAAGRLDDARLAVELLTTDDKVRARILAQQLEGLNKRRQVDQRQISAAAQDMIAADPKLLDDTALVLYGPTWEPGLVGIVAGQLAEQYNRPCILLTGRDIVRGSARSAPGYDIIAAISEQAGLLHEYGGHPGAAGLSLPEGAIDRFRRQLSKALERQKKADIPETLYIDAEVRLDDVTPGFVEEIERLAPFGEGNPPVLLLASHLILAGHSFLGRERLHRKLTVQSDDGATHQVLWWDGGRYPLPEGHFDLTFTVGFDVYRGNRQPAITLHTLREYPEESVVAEPQTALIDWRRRSERDEALRDEFIRLEPDGLIWLEGPHRDAARLPAPVRAELQQNQALLVYTIPPSAFVLRQVLDAVQPQRLYFAGVAPDNQYEGAFLKRLLGLCKRAINQEKGRGELERLAVAAAQTVEAVVWGLRLLALEGAISIQKEYDEFFQIAPAEPSCPAPYDRPEVESTLATLLAEARAYRAFCSHCDIDNLLG